MGGGLLQLVAYGSQDMYLTGNPQITFFKTVYRRHTNFSIESVKQGFQGTPDFGKSVASTLQKNGDLIYKAYLQVHLPKIKLAKSSTDGGIVDNLATKRAFRWLNWIGHVIIKTVEVEIGGQKIDKQTGEWLHLWAELTCPPGKAAGYAEMVGNVPLLTQIYFNYERKRPNNTNIQNETPSGDYNFSDNPFSSATSEITTNEYTLYIPLQFWFCKNPGLALPIIALQYHDININIEFRELNECIWAVALKDDKHSSFKIDNFGGAAITGVSDSGSDILPSINGSETRLYVDYIFLDTEERRRFAQVAHEYLIEQVQFKGSQTITSGASTTSTTEHTIKLNFTHPVKELVWVVQRDEFIDDSYSQQRAGKQYFNYTNRWDFTNFTGTPENWAGPGLKGGRGVQNLWHGLPTVKVEAQFSDLNSDLTDISHTSSSFKEGKLTSVRPDTGVTNENIYQGYNDVKDYTSGIDGYVKLNPGITGGDTLTSANLSSVVLTGNLAIWPETADGNIQLSGDNRMFVQGDYRNRTLSQLMGSHVWTGVGSVSTGNTHTTYNTSTGAPNYEVHDSTVTLLDSGKNPIKKAKITLNGNDRFSEREGFYFNVVQPYQHHTNCPAPGINVYSFALNPEEHQPSGTCNFSRIDSKELNFTLELDNFCTSKTFRVKVYALNYNVLRIMSGMAGLAYSS